MFSSSLSLEIVGLLSTESSPKTPVGVAVLPPRRRPSPREAEQTWCEADHLLSRTGWLPCVGSCPWWGLALGDPPQAPAGEGVGRAVPGAPACLACLQGPSARGFRGSHVSVVHKKPRILFCFCRNGLNLF